MPILEKKIIFSDEAHFDLGGYVNKQNCRIWGTEPTDALKDNTREAIGEIQLHTIYNVLKN